MMSCQEERIKATLKKSIKVIRLYDWLLDLYVLDYFVDNHWDKLPPSWKSSFEDIEPEELGNVISGQPANHMFPLSFLALLTVVKTLSISRDSTRDRTKTVLEKENVAHSKLNNLFLKHVKLKKRHEISLMADVVKETSLKSDCKAVIDFGSGLGHLVRVLTYKHKLYAAGIEGQKQFVEDSRKLDKELEYTAGKHLSTKDLTNIPRPLHFNVTLTSHHQIQNLPLPDNMKQYGLVGLHPCGDLGPLLLRHFVEYDNVRFICVVGCCYMKLTSDSDGKSENVGYPMSQYVKSLDSKLSYVSREIACHAIDVYCDRLKEGRFEDLKVHAYRAALEQLLVEHDAQLKHCPVRSIKHTNNMTIDEYCSVALSRLCGAPAPSARGLERARACACGWRRVAALYSLRLALAPLVETVVLLDRLLYVLEHGLSCEIYPVFDPRISPRNHIIVARR